MSASLRQARLKTAALLLFALALAPAPTTAAKQPSQYRVGDSVEIRRAGDWVPGTVAEVMRTGWLKVKIESVPFPIPVPPDQARPLAKPAEDDNPFATQEERRLRPTLRTWRDSTGRHEVKAVFLKLEDGEVSLRREDGKQITLPLERLSEEDQQYIEELLRGPVDDTPDANTEDDVFVETDLDEARRLDLSATSKWQLEPDPH